MFRFEYDKNKSLNNFRKHGIHFSDATKLWNDPDIIEIPAKTVDEKRYLVIGQIDEVMWSAVITYRNHNIRIISVRRSRKKEIEIYES